jgi:hypothetical protein
LSADILAVVNIFLMKNKKYFSKFPIYGGRCRKGLI